MKRIYRPQYSRLRRIVEILREGTRKGVYPSGSVMAGELEVSWRTIMRDMDYLRDDEGAPIEYDASRKGYKLADQTWNLPPMQVSRKELFAFSVARKMLEGFRGTPLETDMHTVLRKIGESMEGNITLDADSLAENFSVVGEDYVKQDPAIWTEVAGCVERTERAEILYQKFNGQNGRYLLEPYHLVSYHGNWYVLGRVAGRNGISSRNAEIGRVVTFAVSRIRNVRRAGKHFNVQAGFDAREHLREAFGIVRGEKEMNVRLVFSRNVAAYIKERLWHPSQRIRDRRDGGIELRMKTAGWKELVRWILSWQPDVRVLAPGRLRERVNEKMRQALGR